jgi:hypothetical protein
MSEPSEKYEIRTLALSVAPHEDPLYSDRAWRVEIDTEGFGEFIVVRGMDNQYIKIDPDEWAPLVKAVDQLVRECREDR